MIVLAIAGAPAVTRAQDTLIVQPAIPQGFDRGRNVSVQSRPRPSYAPLGARIGGLMIFPQLATAAGVTDNAYLTRGLQVDSAFSTVEPSIRVASLWSRHSIELRASTLIRRYLGQPRRNEQAWDLGGHGKFELGRMLTITGEASAMQRFENLFSAEVAPGISALSRFRRESASLRGEYTRGRLRVFITADHAVFHFAPVRLSGDAIRDQSSRDRTVSRMSGQIELAHTPSASLFAQVAYAGTAFERRTGATLDSSAVRAIAGLNADIAGRVRGTLAVGYSIRDYRAAGFAAVAGPILEGQGELFPTERLSITVAARRTVEDATSGGAMPEPFWNNRLSVGADYEVLRNLILSASGDYALQTYVRADGHGATYRLATQARYLVSRRATLTAGASYTHRRPRDVQPATDVAEGRIEAGLTYHL
jgi:hypothetical protein